MMHVDDTEAPVAGTEGSIRKSRVAVAYTFGGRPGLSVESPFALENYLRKDLKIIYGKISGIRLYRRAAAKGAY